MSIQTRIARVPFSGPGRLARVLRAFACLTLAAFFLPSTVHADPLIPPSAAHILPVDEQPSVAFPKAILPPGGAEAVRTLTKVRGLLPQAFVVNQGQVDERAKLYLRSGRQTLSLTNEDVVFDLVRAVTRARAPTTASSPFGGASQFPLFLEPSC